MFIQIVQCPECYKEITADSYDASSDFISESLYITLVVLQQNTYQLQVDHCLGNVITLHLSLIATIQQN